MHSVNLLAILFLLPSGFFIHKPDFNLFGLNMTTVRHLHVIFGFIFLLNAFSRVYWSILGGPRDIRYFLPERENKGTFLPVLAFYAFLKKAVPAMSRYNPVQKFLYFSWALAILIMGTTGFGMLWTANPFWGWMAHTLGGLGPLHAIHYLTAWFLVSTLPIHVYLILIEDHRAFLIMFLGIEPKGSTK